MDAHRLGIPLAPQFPAAVLEVADQFLLLGVDGNRWITGDDCRLYRGIDVFELRVPVGVVGSLTRLAVSLTAVLLADGCHAVTRYQPTIDKTMRLHAQTAMIENGFVYIPETAAWLAEYLHEMTVFPNGKHDDQVDSTAQFLDWFKRPYPGQNMFELYRRQALELKERNKPQPVQTTWAIGSMEWL